MYFTIVVKEFGHGQGTIDNLLVGSEKYLRFINYCGYKVINGL
jgi:hypothetical protein